MNTKQMSPRKFVAVCDYDQQEKIENNDQDCQQVQTLWHLM